MSAFLAWRIGTQFGLAVAMSCALAAVLSTADADQQDPAAVLARHGLKRIDRVWVVAEELRLRQELAELPKRRQRIVAVERDLDERIETNRKRWQEAQPAIAALRKSLARLGTDDPQRAALEQQIDVLTAAASDPARLGGRGEVRARVLYWIDERNGLAAALSQISGTIGALGEIYARLAQAPGVAEAVRLSGEKQRLGPQRNYEADREKLADYERLAFTPWVPIFWQGSQLRLTALIDEQSPVTFTWSDSGGPGIVLTRSAAEAAGLAIPADAPRETISRSPQLRTTARRIEVGRLRLGKYVLKQVAVLVLPAEAEDWGCQIGRDALSGHSVKIEAERLRLWIDAG